MNKRNTEGYVLIYLLVAITVIGLVASALMASTLKVVQAQEQSLVYMQKKYNAQGKIEKLMSELPSVGSGDSSSGFSSPDSATEAGIEAVLNTIDEFTQDIDPDIVSVSAVDTADNSFEIIVNVDPVCITATAVVFPNISVSSYDESRDTGEKDEYGHPILETVTKWKYTVLESSLSFSSYKITSTGGGT